MKFLLAMPRPGSPRGVMPEGRGADVLRVVIVIKVCVLQATTYRAPNLSLSMAGTSFREQLEVEYLILGLPAPSLGE